MMRRTAFHLARFEGFEIGGPEDYFILGCCSVLMCNCIICVMWVSIRK